MLMFSKKMRKNKKGFTLTELIVVVAILGVLAAVATPLVTSRLAAAQQGADEANARTLENTIKMRVAEGGLTLPDTVADIRTAIAGQITIMDCERDTFDFWVNVNTGAVVSASADPDTGGATNWEQLNP